MTEIPEETDCIVQHYKKLAVVGSGTYGKVYKAVNTLTNEIVAVKEITTTEEEKQEGIQSTTLREMSILTMLKGQPNIVQLKEVILSSDYKQYLVLEFVNTDLQTIIKNNQLDEPQIKLYLHQMLTGLVAIHSRLLFHRDIKPANILVHNGVAKIADFGLAKPIGYPINRTHTKEVQTLWYRAPELFLGNFKYSPALDVFSLGCIFYEMANRDVLFKGDSEIGQIFKIFHLMGTPFDWSGFTSMPYHSPKFPHFPGCWHEIPNMTMQGRNLLHSMLMIDPSKRISAREALKHPYFDDL